MQHRNWDYSHPKRIARLEWLRERHIPTLGKRRGRRRHHQSGCYGVCCGQGMRPTRLCTVCRKTKANVRICCGYYTVRVNPRIEVPRAGADNRWKEFLKRFPGFKFRETLKYIPGAEPPESENWALAA